MNDRVKVAAFDAVATVADDAPDGHFEAVVAVFGNVDSQGDIVDPGAFTESLAEWAAKGKPVPVIWSHEWEDPFSHIGGCTATETDQGLLVSADLDMTNPTAAQIYKLLKSGRVNQFSFVARAAAGGWSVETLEDGTVVSHLSKLDLIEVGPTLRGANAETQLVSIKSATDALSEEDVAGLGSTVETIKSIHEQLGGIIAAVEKASPPPGGKEDVKTPDRPVSFVLPAVRAKAIASLIGKES